MSNLLAAVGFSLPAQGYQVGLDWLGHFARIIIEGVGIVGVGIIVFTLVLKAITLPFDIYQRVTMRKQNLIMQQMQPELEKLQKQYANDKTMYNQKMVELQKKSGYSILGACLPMIISLVILIVAFSGFRTYSQYANLNLFVHMSEQYNAAVLENSVERGTDFRVSLENVEDDEHTVGFEKGVYDAGDDSRIYEMFYYENNVLDENNNLIVENGTFKTAEDTNAPRMSVKSSDPSKFIYYTYSMKDTGTSAYGKYDYFIDVDRLYNVTQNEELKKIIDETRPDAATDLTVAAVRDKQTKLSKACNDYIVSIGAEAAAQYFKSPEHTPSFLWIKNVWYPDVSYNHPIPTYSDFKNQLNVKVTLEDGTQRDVAQMIGDVEYENLTSHLQAEKEEPNGYFILIVLSIGLMVLSQIITMKSSKTANKYQTVDGQGANTQKVMLVVMPLIYALFAFMYSAAFSIYMCMSSIVAILVTVFSNLILDHIFTKKEEEAFRKENTRTLPWMEQQQPQNGKKKHKK